MAGSRLIILSPCQCAALVILIQVLLIVYLQLTLQEPLLAMVTGYDGNEPIDAVYTWVNGSDEHFQQQLHKYSAGIPRNPSNNGAHRYADRDELRYSLRSLEKHAPWIRHVYIVTNGQVPSWLDVNNGRVTIIPHAVIFPNASSVLPTFSSPAIELNLHRIPGVSRHFLYLNDDLLLGQPIDPSTFYRRADGMVLYWDYALPACANLCVWARVHNGNCDVYCNVPDCQMDGGDCAGGRGSRRLRFPMPPLNTHDAYAQSLQHTQRTLNAHFGYALRKVPPHMPLLVNRNAMYDAWEDFHEALANTTAQRFRTNTDIQFQLFYTYYIRHKTRRLHLQEVLRGEDLNADSYLDDTELETIMVKHFGRRAVGDQRREFQATLLKCARADDVVMDDGMRHVRVDNLERCRALEVLLRDTLLRTVKYAHTFQSATADEGFYRFKPLFSNIKKVAVELDEIRRMPRKFICLNDDLRYTSELAVVNAQVRDALQVFYESMFPVHSKYELRGVRNDFNYIENRESVPYQEENKGTFNFKVFYGLILCAVFVWMCYLFCIKKQLDVATKMNE